MNKEEQIELEQKYANNHLLERCIKEVSELTSDKKEQLFLAYLVIYKRVNPETMIGLLRKKFTTLQECANTIENYINKGLALWDDTKEQIVIKYDVDNATRQELDLYQYPLPMFTEPNKLKNNWDTGYETIRQFIVTNIASSNNDFNLSHINRVNSIPLEINKGVLAHCENKWNCKSNMSKKNFEKYTKYAKVICEFAGNQDKFYLMHRYDKRGRIYSLGYYILDQGNDWNKAMILFHNKELVK